MKAWEAGQPGLISVQAFVNQKYAVLNELKRQAILERPYGNVIASESDLEKASVEPFVNLLVEIEADDEITEMAIENFVRFNTDICDFYRKEISKPWTGRPSSTPLFIDGLRSDPGKD